MSAHAVAIADYMHASRITTIDSSEYQGRPGNRIWVVATDNFTVVAVQVRLYDPTGEPRITAMRTTTSPAAEILDRHTATAE